MFRKLFNSIFLAAIALTPAVITNAQTGRGTDLWKWTTQATNEPAIVQVFCNGGFGTGVIAQVFSTLSVADGYQGLCLTAWHVVKSDPGNREIKVTYKNGRSSKNCRIMAWDEPNDVAVIWVWVPPDIVAAPIAIKAAISGDHLEFAGLGGGSKLDCCLRCFSAPAAMTTDPNTIFSDAALLPGDSGGPVFNIAGQLIGIISGGWFWWDGGVKTEEGATVKATWPARACNLDPILSVLAKAQLAME